MSPFGEKINESFLRKNANAVSNVMHFKHKIVHLFFSKRWCSEAKVFILIIKQVFFLPKKFIKFEKKEGCDKRINYTE